MDEDQGMRLALLQLELQRLILQELRELRQHERHDDRKLHEELAAIAAAIKAGSTDPILNQEAEKLTALAAKLGQIAPAGPAENVPT